MSYWPSYASIPDRCRAAYLQWLAAGRRSRGAYIGYVFLFFYGLERRVLHDRFYSQLAQAESRAILAEVEALLEVYGGNSSFKRYATSFLEIGRALDPETRLEVLTPPEEKVGWETPSTVKLALGRYAASGLPLPAEWALSWVLTSGSFPLRTPAQRCRNEFRELFRLRYQEQFGDGMKLKQVKTRLVLEYQPASMSFGGPIELSVGDLPDVTRSTATLTRLVSLAEAASQELDAFSRWVGRTQDYSSPSALALLPPILSNLRGGEEVQAFTGWLEQQFGNEEVALVLVADLLENFSAQQTGAVNLRDLKLLGAFLASRGIGLEPDPMLDGSSLAKSKRAALFRLETDKVEEPGTAFRMATLLLHLAAFVAAADGEVSASEERHLAEHLERALHLSPAERKRLRARLRWLVGEPPTLAGVKKRSEGMSQVDRNGLGSFLLSVAGADGRLSGEELKVLAKVYLLLGLDPQTIYSDVHGLMSAQAPPATEPVTSRLGTAGTSGFRIPGPPPDELASGVRLDLGKVQAKLAESERVAELLSEIFVEEEMAEPPAPLLRVAPPDDFGIPGLDSLHSALLLHLSMSTSWDRAEVERFSTSLGLFPDGALEVINEVAFSRCGSPVIEGDEVLEVEEQVLREMLT